MLAEFYKKAKDEGKHIEIIFISSDQDEEQFKSYYAEMPWLTIGFDAEKKVDTAVL